MDRSKIQKDSIRFSFFFSFLSFFILSSFLSSLFSSFLLFFLLFFFPFFLLLFLLSFAFFFFFHSFFTFFFRFFFIFFFGRFLVSSHPLLSLRISPYLFYLFISIHIEGTTKAVCISRWLRAVLRFHRKSMFLSVKLCARARRSILMQINMAASTNSCSTGSQCTYLCSYVLICKVMRTRSPLDINLY